MYSKITVNSRALHAYEYSKVDACPTWGPGIFYKDSDHIHWYLSLYDSALLHLIWILRGQKGDEKKGEMETARNHMSAVDSQFNSARNYDDQYDDEDISESGGWSPGHSDDVQAIEA
nr:hypothetical protein Iba_chr09aCG13800 [Ipomoea batatas]